MSINIGITFVFAGMHAGSDQTHHPDNSKKMINMFVCDKNFMNIINRNMHLFQLTENFHATSAIYKKMSVVIRDDKTGVVTFSNYRMTGSKHCYFHSH